MFDFYGKKKEKKNSTYAKRTTKKCILSEPLKIEEKWSIWDTNQASLASKSTGNDDCARLKEK